MTHIHTDTSNPGATFLGRTTEGTLRALIIDLMVRHPKATEDKLFSLFERALDEDPRYEQAARNYTFTNFYRYEKRRRAQPKPSPQGSPSADRSAASRAEREEQMKEKVASIKGQIVLLNLTMLNGKAMRDCTGIEMGQFGKSYEKIAKRVGKKMVGEVLNEIQVRALM